MSESKRTQVAFHAPLHAEDREDATVGCRANNPNICRNNGIPEVCAFIREDGMCTRPSKAWKKQFYKLKGDNENDII